MKIIATKKGITIGKKTYKVENTLSNIIWIVYKEILKKNGRKENKNMVINQIDIVAKFQNKFNDISPFEIEKIMEYFEDQQMLTERGTAFRNMFWEIFIHEKEK